MVVYLVLRLVGGNANGAYFSRLIHKKSAPFFYFGPKPFWIVEADINSNSNSRFMHIARVSYIR